MSFLNLVTSLRHYFLAGLFLLTTHYSQLTVHHRIRLNLHQHLRRNQFAHLDHAGRRSYCREKLPMRPPNLFPFRNVGHKNPRPHHILQRRPSFPQRSLNIPNRLHRLRVSIAHTHNLPVRSSRRSPRNRDHVPDFHRPGVPHNRFPSRSARNILPCQIRLLCRTSLCRREAAC